MRNEMPDKIWAYSDYLWSRKDTGVDSDPSTEYTLTTVAEAEKREITDALGRFIRANIANWGEQHQIEELNEALNNAEYVFAKHTTSDTTGGRDE